MCVYVCVSMIAFALILAWRLRFLNICVCVLIQLYRHDFAFIFFIFFFDYVRCLGAVRYRLAVDRLPDRDDVV